jgi:hypothetical protein
VPPDLSGKARANSRASRSEESPPRVSSTGTIAVCAGGLSSVPRAEKPAARYVQPSSGIPMRASVAAGSAYDTKILG